MLKCKREADLENGLYCAGYVIDEKLRGGVFSFRSKLEDKYSLQQQLEWEVLQSLVKCYTYVERDLQFYMDTFVYPCSTLDRDIQVHL